MKIWEKNYVLTMALLLIVLFGGIFFIQQYSFYENLDRCCENSLFNENRIEYSISAFLADQNDGRRLKWYCQSLEKQNIYLKIENKEKLLADGRPFLWHSDTQKDFQIIKNNNNIYICIASTYTDLSSGKVSIVYMEEISAVYKTQKKQMFIPLAAGILVSLLFAGILYGVMKRIYSPVSNIAHELRTPLTAIQGYAQYIQLGNITAEDTAFASSQIDEQAQHMNVMIENLLIMGNLWDGKIKMKQIETDTLVKDLKQFFPFLSVDNQTKYLYGDKVLLLSLLRNLISNTCRQGEEVSLSFCKDSITIYNKDDYLEKKMLDILNGGRSIPKEKINGKGLGVPLCREIVKLHQGKLLYKNIAEGGVEIQIIFH